MYCAANTDRLVRKSDIAIKCNASENHLAQVIHQLAQLGYLYTQRGRNGGLSLARPATEIEIGEVFRAIEGPVPLAECFADSDDSCPLTSVCRLRDALTAAAEAFFSHMDGISLDDLVCGNAPLLELLGDQSCSRAVASAPAEDVMA